MLNQIPEAIMQAAKEGMVVSAAAGAVILAVAAVIVFTGCWLAYKRWDRKRP